jgi:hypothetical protein
VVTKLALLCLLLACAPGPSNPVARPVVASLVLELSADMQRKTGDRYRVIVPVQDSIGVYETLAVIINKTTKRERMPK